MGGPFFGGEKHRDPEGEESTLDRAYRIDPASLCFGIKKEAVAVAMLPDTRAPLQRDDMRGRKGLTGESEIVRYGVPLFGGKPYGSGLPSATAPAPDTFKK